MARPRGHRLNPFAVRDLLSAKGITMTDAAERCGIPLTTFSSLMHGDMRASTKTIVKLSEGLACARETLFPELAFPDLRETGQAGA